MDKKIEELLNVAKMNSLLHPIKESESKKDNPYVVALVIVGAIALIAGIAYAVYYFFVPDKLVDFEDDFDDVYGDEVFAEPEVEEIVEETK
ncbi:MAG: DUF4366 domain-containing protein [Catonella sp.]|uniref:DUF4366 domain-containing protein n=1 Tax=Catonella sp. TaxID=2382125 RepID=UPI003FA114D6